MVAKADPRGPTPAGASGPLANGSRSGGVADAWESNTLGCLPLMFTPLNVATTRKRACHR